MTNTLTQTLSWTNLYSFQRIEAVIRCGWCNKNYNATLMGKRIANTEWLNLSECARNVLINHGFNQ
jgi:hypothetical protein